MYDDLFNYAAHQQEQVMARKPEPVEAIKKKRNAAIPLPATMIREALEIDETVPSGLRWRVRPRHHFATERGWKTRNTRDAGRPAGTRQGSTVYFKIGIGGSEYAGHRVVFLLANGVDPGEKSVDHICQALPIPNVASNLRLALHRENLRNQKKHRDNTSGTTGVRLNKKAKKWEAFIVVNYRHVYLGLFADKNDAIDARKAAEVECFGEFSYSASQKINTNANAA